MPSDPFFSRSNRENSDDEAPAADEGVRIIGADEVAEATDRPDVARRQGNDRPRYGDRPAPPPEGARPALRFPLAAEASQFDRPRPAPVEPRAADPGDTGRDERPDIDADALAAGAGAEPVISVEPATGQTELPHWTDPPTGEVPKVIIGDVEEGDEDGRWSSFASSGPRWRDERDEWDDEVADLADLAEPEDTSVHALGGEPSQMEMSQDEYLNFDDLEVPVAPGRSRSEEVAMVTDLGEFAEFEGVDLVDEELQAPIHIHSTPQAAAPPPPRTPTRRARAARVEGEPGDEGGPRRRSPHDEEPPASGRDVPQAVFVGVVMAAVAVVLFWLGPAPTMILVVATLAVAALELFEGLRRGGYRPATLLALVAVVALPLAVYWRGESAIPLVLALTVVFATLWYLAGVGGNARPVPNIGVTLLGVLYVGLLGSFAALILDIPVEGVSILLVAVMAAVAYDIVGFFVGRSIGRTPLTAVSPNKTLEGLIGGMAGSLFTTFVVAVVLGFGPFGVGSWLVFGICCAVAAPVGDLAESLFKRDLGIKDMGTILPGHGGVLDRCDGLLFVLPTAYYVVRVLDLVPLP